HLDSLYDSGGRWRRLELESFDTPAEETPAADADAAAEAAPALPDPAEVLAEIERLRDAARTRGQAEGFAAGHTQGFEAGFAEGREEGFAEVMHAGVTDELTQGEYAARQEDEKIQAQDEAFASSIEQLEE